MSLLTPLRDALAKLPFTFVKKSALPPGADLQYDITQRLKLDPKVIFIVGAHEGNSTTHFSRKFSGAKIYSFEPVYNTYQKLRENTRHISNVTAEQYALAEEEGSQTISLYHTSQSELNTLNPEVMNNIHGEKETIIKKTVDGYCRENGIKTIDLLKISATGGYEIPILNGATEMLEKKSINLVTCVVSFNEYNKNFTYFSKVNSHLSEKGFQYFCIWKTHLHQIKTGFHYAQVLYAHADLLARRFLLLTGVLLHDFFGGPMLFEYAWVL